MFFLELHDSVLHFVQFPLSFLKLPRPQVQLLRLLPHLPEIALIIFDLGGALKLQPADDMLEFIDPGSLLLRLFSFVLQQFSHSFGLSFLQLILIALGLVDKCNLLLVLRS